MDETSKQDRAELYSALVWIVAGISLVIYSTIGFLNYSIPGVEQLVSFLSSIEGKYLYISAFISIFIEGLYFVGSFFPGTTLVVLLAVLSQVAGLAVFVGTVVSIFIGWCLAGAVNIWFAKTYRARVAGLEVDEGYAIHDRVWTTWFPAFRANYEVAQIAGGGKPLQVFFSSVRVKLWASLAATLLALVLPLFIDISEVSNEEGFTTVAIVATISFVVGGVKLRKYFRART